MTNKYMYFVANWKMFGNFKSLNQLDKVITFVKKFKKNKTKLIYCPPATLINAVSKKLKFTTIDVGAQNCHQGLNYGAKYIILGHSENRQLGEDNNLINLKIRSSIKSSLKIIFCIGET